MPRVAGQIDEAKTEAILEAASRLIHERGAAVSMEAIAREAGVSKQTLYNRFPSKLEVARALAARRSEAVTQPLRTGGDPEAVLTAFALGLLNKVRHDQSGASLRNVALMSPEVPDLAEAVYDAGPAEGLRRLADWLAIQTREGRLSTPDPLAAAEMFAGMTLGHAHLRAVLGVAQPPIDAVERARETAQRFLRAFAA